VQRWAVNQEAGNAWAAWCEMGRPRSPRPGQLDALREAAEPARAHHSVPMVDGRVELVATLARHEVTLFDITAVVNETPPWWDDSRLLGGPPNSAGNGREDSDE
jgi:xylan 1,4-beta-xylosidase